MSTAVIRKPILFVFLTVLIVAGFGFGNPGFADNKVVLTITGKIATTGSDDKRDFTLEELEQLGMDSFTSENTWLEGTHKFEGVPFRKILETVNATGDTLYATALNDYTVDIPIDALTDRPALLVTRIDGELIPVREKGPIWILYPQSDNHSEYRRAPFVNYMVWQLRFIDVR